MVFFSGYAVRPNVRVILTDLHDEVQMGTTLVEIPVFRLNVVLVFTRPPCGKTSMYTNCPFYTNAGITVYSLSCIRGTPDTFYCRTSVKSRLVIRLLWLLVSVFSRS